MQIQDERTTEEKEHLPLLIVGTDSFLSGWGKAEGGKSYAAWACQKRDENRVLEWVEKRSDMKRVRVVYGSYRPSGKGHLHVYPVLENHPSLN
jgi:hypothetical protein